MAVFVLLTTMPRAQGSPESRRPGVTEPVDADPRDFAERARIGTVAGPARRLDPARL